MERLKLWGKRWGLFCIALTWCVLQTVIGGLFALCLLPTSRTQRYRGMIVLYHPLSFTFSLGTFAFVSDRADRPREARGRMYGHYLQSLLYGPFFLFLVSLSQLIVRFPALRHHREERGLMPEDWYFDRQAVMFAARFGE